MTVAPAFARTFSSPDGQLVLAHLENITLYRVTGPAVTDAELRFLEGERFIVHYIKNFIRRGKDNASSKGEKNDG